MKTSNLWTILLCGCALWGLAHAPAFGGPLLPDGTPNPADANLLLWLKADAGVSVGAGNKVSAWANQSTYAAYVATEATSTLQPTFAPDALNGQDVVAFAAGQRLLFGTTATPTGPTGHQTLFVVYQDTSTTAYATPLGTSYNGRGSYHGAANDAALFDAGNTDPKTTGGSNFRNGLSIGNGLSTPRPDNYGIFAYVGTAPLTQTVWAVGADQPCCGDRSIRGGIAEILLYNRALTPTEQIAVGAYLRQKYSLDAAYFAPSPFVGWNLARDWDPTDGVPNQSPRAWYYQKRTTAGAYVDLTNWSKQSWWTGGNAWLDPSGYPLVGPRVNDYDHLESTVDAYIARHNVAQMDLLGLHPGAAEDAVVTWRNPLPGTRDFLIDGLVWHVDDTGSDGVNFSISRSGTGGAGDSLLATSITGLAAATVTLNAADALTPDYASFLFRLTLSQGDEIHFRVNARSGLGSDAVMLGLAISEVPEPASLVLLAIGTVMLTGARGRRRK